MWDVDERWPAHSTLTPGVYGRGSSILADGKLIALGEGGMLEFRAEGFNVLNRPNFGLPNRIVFSALPSSVTENPLSTAGQITTTVGTSRQIQLALKILF